MGGSGNRPQASLQQQVPAAAPVRRRAAFYIPGYDPFSARRYRELYRTEAARQAAISGYTLTVGPRPRGDGAYGWRIAACIDGQSVDTDLRFMVWNDLVKASMARSIPGTYWLMLVTLWRFLASGALIPLFRLRRGPVIAGMYPIVMLLMQLGFAALLGRWVRMGLLAWTPAPFWLALIAGLVVLAGVLVVFQRLDRYFYAYYLMHDYAFTAATMGAYSPALSDRMDRFAERIAAALDSDVDEVLVIGHSTGAALAVSVLARVLRALPPDHPPGPAIGLLTVGHAIPVTSFLPGARELRRDLAFLSTHPWITWVDVSAPGDGGCYALCDPVAVSGIAPDDQRWPVMISCAYSRTLSPDNQRRLRWRFFRRHIQYLCAFDRPETYDYFAITAGPYSLAERFGNRGSSRSRIARPLSPHTDT